MRGEAAWQGLTEGQRGTVLAGGSPRCIRWRITSSLACILTNQAPPA